MFDELAGWRTRQWVTAAGAAVAIALLVGLPTDVIPNPVFGRPVVVTWWSYPVLALTALVGGLLVATYVRTGDDDLDRPARTASVGGLLSFFAVGCPVCNKLVVVALGATGARSWFEPIQPLLAVVSLGLLVWALRTRLRNARSCPVPSIGLAP